MGKEVIMDDINATLQHLRGGGVMEKAYSLTTNKWINGAVYYLIFTPENITFHYRVKKCPQMLNTQYSFNINMKFHLLCGIIL